MSEHILTRKHQAHKHHTHTHAALGWRIHCGVEVTEWSTNKQYSLFMPVVVCRLVTTWAIAGYEPKDGAGSTEALGFGRASSMKGILKGCHTTGSYPTGVQDMTTLESQVAELMARHATALLHESD